METNSNLLGVWAETQTKAMNNWMSTTKKYQESAAKGDLLQKGMDFYKEWFDNQKSLMNEALQSTSSKVTENSPEFMQTLLKQQKEFTEKWIEMMNSATQQPREWSENWLAESKKMYDTWAELLTKSYGNMTNMEFVPGNFSKNAFSSMVDYSKAYISMMEVWKPFYQMLSNKQYDMSELTKVWGMNGEAAKKLQESVQAMFGFMMPNSNMTEQYNKIVASFSEYFKAFEPFKKGMDAFKNMDFMKMDFGQLYQIQDGIAKQYNKMYEPFTKLFPNNNVLANTENMVNMQNMVMKYLSKYAEMQFIIGEASRKSVEETAEKLFEMAKTGQYNQTYSEFFNQWLATVEEKMIELFNGTHFSALQSDLVALGLDIKKSLEENMEKSLNAYPIATRTEIDGLHKQIYELKKLVRDLQRKLGEETIDLVVEENGEVKPSRGRKK